MTFERQWRADRDRFPAEMVGVMAWAESKSARDAARASALMATGVPLLRSLQGAADCLLLPTTPQEQFDMEPPAPANQADLTVLPNIAGVPAVSVPMPALAGERSAGLQIVASQGQYLAALALAQAYEGALSGPSA